MMLIRALYAFLFVALLAGVTRADDRPNIVFFFTDDQAYDTLGCYGNPDVKTPNIDGLAQRGVVFDRHYNTTAICMASRANVMTGLYEYKSGCNFMHGPLTRDIWQRSYPVLLRSAGYRTGFGGKFGFAVVDHPGEEGSEKSYDHLPVADFDFWVGGTGQTSYVTRENKYLAPYADRYPHSTRAYGAAGQDFIRQSVQEGKPFCLSLFFKAPHKPAEPDPAFDSVYADTVFRKLPNYGREAGEHLAAQHKLGRQYPRFVQWGYHTDETYQRELRLYHQQIYGIDRAIGMVLEELKRQGLADNTVVLFSSDNGYFNGSHGLGSKVLLYEEGARVPLIIADPRHADAGKARRTEAITGNIDIAATILDLAGVPIPDWMDGVSLQPIVEDSAPRVRDVMTLIQAWGTAGTFSLGVVTEHHKYIYWPYADGMKPGEELFDLQNDPYELKNVVGDAHQQQALAAMQQHYDAAVADWKENAVDYNGYGPLGRFYDRHVEWQEKASLLPPQFPVNGDKGSKDRETRSGDNAGRESRGAG